MPSTARFMLVLIARIVSFRYAVWRFKSLHLVSFLVLIVGLGACRQPGLKQFQPDVPRGGRAVAIDVDPLDSQVALVASERGGIFRTTDGGAHWAHIDAFPSVAIADLRFIPNTNPAVAIATAAPDGWIEPALNNGGIWRSADAGLTWSHADLSKLCDAPGRDARGIGFTPNASAVYVATWDCGVVSSLSSGATWDTQAYFYSANSVVAPSSTVLDICTPFGHFRSINGGTWIPDANTTSPLPDCAKPHSLAVSPIESNVLFATAGTTILESDSAGATGWSDLLASPNNSGFRPNWVVARPVSATQFDLYSPGQRQTCTGPASGQRCSTSWQGVPASSLNHDLSDVAFPASGRCPVFMAIDFGIVQADAPGTTVCTDGSSWNLTGGGAGGYDALQIYDVVGQVNQQAATTNLYIGTQDNHLWGDNSALTTGWVDLISNDNLRLDTPNSALPIDPGFLGVTGVTCCPGSGFYVPRTAAGGWGAVQMNWGFGIGAAIVEPQVYVEYHGNNLSMTTTMGQSWIPVATLPLSPINEKPRVAGPPSNPTVYGALIQPGWSAINLAKITGIRGANGSAQTGVLTCIGNGCQPAFGTSLDSVYVYCPDGTCYSVFAVDPTDPNHLIAADAGTGEMKVSTNGGALWTVDQQLTSAVTMNGKLSFAPDVIYFDRAGSSRIFVGTSQAGLIVSTDGGQTWTTIVDSPNLNTITSLFSDPSSKYAYVATFSRGLWRLNMVPPDYKELLTYVGDFRGVRLFPATLAATFINDSRTPPLPIANAGINFRIRNSGQGCTALTDATGKAQCNVTFYSPGTYIVDTRFAGDAQYTATAISSYFYVQ
jgi:hypothetical protein